MRIYILVVLSDMAKKSPTYPHAFSCLSPALRSTIENMNPNEPRRVLQELHDNYIAGSYAGDLVGLDRDKLCTLTRAVSRALGFDGLGSAYIRTRALKHIYEQRTAAEYQLILDKLHSLVKRPTHIYLNKPGKKRGTHCLVAPLRDQEFICAIEIIADAEIEIATVFERRDRYTNGCELLWSWGDGTTSHRNALDAD